MRTPNILTGTLLGAAFAALIINPCNGGAASGAIIGAVLGLLVDCEQRFRNK
jgi:hypothetical protein